ncbi:hypothetical protein IF650_19670 [Cellulosimicrobium terreum]|nr:hypothetical protein [Cellulosimicrobium terreum]
MSSPRTPAELVAELGVPRSTVYAWLREAFPLPFEGRWFLDDDQVQQARAHFTTTTPPRTRHRVTCTVQKCDRDVKARGLCKMHYDRWYRTGTIDGVGKGGRQRAKTHCPQGHEYTLENTLVYPSEDGRRRCRTCRPGAASVTKPDVVETPKVQEKRTR